MSSMQSNDEQGQSVSAFLPSTDGQMIAQVRVPGGRVRAPQWEALADLSDEFGRGELRLSSPSSLHIPGVEDTGTLNTRLNDHGLAGTTVPAIMCSPLLPGLGELVDALVATLPSNGTVFGIDAGDGAIIAKQPDFALLAAETAGSFHLVVSGQPTGLLISRDDAVEALTTVVTHGNTPPTVGSHLDGLIQGHCEPILPPAPSRPAPIGWIQNGDHVTLGAGLRDGQLDSRLARFLAAIETDIWITPWNSLVIHGLSDGVADQVVKVLAPMGLIFDANSPWLHD